MNIFLKLIGAVILSMSFSVAALAKESEKAGGGDSLKIAYVSINEAVDRTGEQRRIRRILEADKNKIQEIIRKRSDRYKKEADEIKKSMAILSDDERMKKYEEIQKMQLSLEQFVKSKEIEFQKKEADLRKKVIDKIQRASAQVAKTEKVQVIRNRDGVLWVDEEMDLTNKVVSLYKSKFRSK